MTTLGSRSPGVTVLCGNPRSSSRTLGAALEVAAELVRYGATAGDPAVVELADLGRELWTADRPGVETALSLVTHSDLLVVATPVYKGSYTGLLKAFLDLLPHRGLDGVVAVPVVVMGHPVHALAAEVHLRPLLVELGATVPTGSVALTEEQVAAGPAAVRAWGEHQAPLAVAAARHLHRPAVREEASA